MPLELRFTQTTTTLRGYDNRDRTEDRGCLRKAFNGVSEIVITGATVSELLCNAFRPPSNILFANLVELPVFYNVLFSKDLIQTVTREYPHPDLPRVLRRLLMSVSKRPSSPTDAFPDVPYETALEIAEKCGLDINYNHVPLIRFDSEFRVIDPDRMRQVGLATVFANFFWQHNLSNDRHFAFSPDLQGLFDEYLQSIVGSGKCEILIRNVRVHIPTKKYTQDFYNLSWNVFFSETEIGHFTVVTPDPDPVPDTESAEPVLDDTAAILARITEISNQLLELKAAFGCPGNDSNSHPQMADSTIVDPMTVDLLN